jgi:hypothetical protein
MDQKDEGLPDLQWLNKTELLELLLKPGLGSYRLSHAVSEERLIQLIETGAEPQPHERSKTCKTRADLEVWVSKNSGVISQLPCHGPLQGKCTIYPCSDTRHMSCWLRSEKHR